MIIHIPLYQIDIGWHSAITVERSLMYILNQSKF